MNQNLNNYHIIKYKSSLLRIFILVCLFSLFGSNAQSQNSIPINIASDWGFPPFEYINDNGKPDGFAIEIAKATLESQGYKYNIQLDFWPSVLKNLEKGKINLITGMVVSPERKKKYYFSEPFGKIKYGIAGVKEKVNNIKSINDLREKELLINASDYDDGFIPQNLSPNIFICDQAEIGLKELSNGRYDFMVCSTDMARFYIEYLGYGNLSVKELDLPQKDIAMASLDSTLITKVNAGLKAIKNNGTYDALNNKWFVEPQHDRNIPYYWLIPLLIIILLCGIFILILRRKIKKAVSKTEREKNKLSLAIYAGRIKVWAYRIDNGKFTNVEGFNIKKDGITEDSVFEKYIHPDDKQECLIALKNLREGNSQKSLYIKAREKSADDWKKVEIEFSILYDDDGRPQTIIGTFRDVTSEVEYKELLEYQKKKMEFAIRGGEMMLWEYDVPSHLFTCYNEPIQGHYYEGYMLPQDYYQIVHPKDLNSLKSIIENLMDHGENKSYNIDLRYKILIEDKNWRYCTLTGAPIEFDKSGKATKYTGLRKDTTALIDANVKAQKYLEKLNYILISSQLLSFDYNLSTKCISISSGDNNIITLSAANYVLRNHPDDREKLREFIEKLDNAEIDTYNAQRRILLPRHTEKNECTYVTIYGTAIRDDEGKIVSYSGLRRNITQLVEIQRKLEKAKSDAEQADKLKSAFLANMSHEIRTPLNAIVGFSELLVDAEDKEERQEYMNIINTNNDLLLRLIGDILDLSKIESGMMEFKNQEFDLALLFSEIGKSLSQRIQNPRISLKINHPYKRCLVCLDSNRVAQIITNFGTNAIKYSAEGTITMNYEADRNGVKLSIQDTGIGIPDDKKDKIFQRFEKLDNFAQGTGLGLSICKAIVEACEGKIGFESQQGVGSTFWAWFPCKPKIEE